MRKSAALFPIALAAIILAPAAGAREPTPLRKCQTISQPGSYELADNLTSTGSCLVIAADFVTVDLAGFSISGVPAIGAVGILTAPSSGELRGIAVRNGSISGFDIAVDLHSAFGSFVEGLRVFAFGSPGGITANGIVKDNIVSGIRGTGISATGIVTGNIASGNEEGIQVGQGSTVIGNIPRTTFMSELAWVVRLT
jgi:hypothetical protein